MTYKEAMEISKGEGKSVRHPDMAEGHTVRYSPLIGAAREHPGGKVTKFRPGVIEQQRNDWYVV